MSAIRTVESIAFRARNCFLIDDVQRMKFYAIAPVDKFIYERYFDGRQIPGVAIECGAFDGLTESSCKFFEESLSWTCVNVEPYPPAFEKLVVNRPLSTNINVALSSSTTSVEFTAVIHPLFGADCNNGSIQHTEKHKQILDDIGCTYKRYQVATTTYYELVIAHRLETVDLFVLDVEGHEREVLKGMRNSSGANAEIFLHRTWPYRCRGAQANSPGTRLRVRHAVLRQLFYVRNDIAEARALTGPGKVLRPDSLHTPSPFNRPNAQDRGIRTATNHAQPRDCRRMPRIIDTKDRRRLPRRVNCRARQSVALDIEPSQQRVRNRRRLDARPTDAFHPYGQRQRALSIRLGDGRIHILVFRTVVAQHEVGMSGPARSWPLECD
jgi:FkbM family methyltransferase